MNNVLKNLEKPLHIETESMDDIADIVLMPGDPLRAKYIADNFLENAKLVSSVRNMYAYTGYYKNKRVSVVGSGMGMPSMSIYAFELFFFYNVKKIIRIGTCGVVSPEVKVPEIILADLVYSETNFDYTLDSNHRGTILPNKELNEDIIKTAKELNMGIHVGSIITCDCFGPYIEMDKVLERVPENINLLGEEMEAYALMVLGDKMNRQTSCLLTAVDSKFSDIVLTPKDRQTSLDNMIILALNSIIK